MPPETRGGSVGFVRAVKSLDRRESSIHWDDGAWSDAISEHGVEAQVCRSPCEEFSVGHVDRRVERRCPRSVAEHGQ